LIDCLISFSAPASAEDFQLQQQQQGDFRQVGHYGRVPVSFSSLQVPNVPRFFFLLLKIVVKSPFFENEYFKMQKIAE
jgi:hypothetical protein